MGQVFLLPLVVLIEAAFIRAFLGGSRLLALWHSFLMNLASTLLGVAMYIATGPLIGDSLYNFWWRSGFDGQRVTAIFISAVFAVVLFAISWVIETIVLRRLRPASPGMQVVRTIGIANAVTYVVLMGLAVAGA
jgi:hypothetical protein